MVGVVVTESAFFAIIARRMIFWFGGYADRKAVVLICGGNPSPAIHDLLMKRSA